MESLHRRFRAAGELLARNPSHFDGMVQFLEALADGEGDDQLRERFELAGNRLASHPACYAAVVECVEAVAAGEEYPFTVLMSDAFRLIWGGTAGDDAQQGAER